jgi:8-oxo-dGTP diphosphatase
MPSWATCAKPVRGGPYRGGVAIGDGNGWVFCRYGHRHWGRHGAAGLLLLRRLDAPQVLLQLRAAWTHEGGRWGLVGGARDSHETLAEAALREAAEEADVTPSAVQVVGEQVGADHVDWTYTYVIGVAVRDVEPRVLTEESDDLRWVDVADVPGLPLHRGLESAWGALVPGITELAATCAAAQPDLPE